MKARERPSLLCIHSDQHSPFVAGCYGDALARTPNLDRLAESGVVFGNAYCPSPICVPSRMSMLTGRQPHENRVWTNQHVLDSSLPTWAHALGAVGYHPVLIGRMHALGPDQLHGYAERLVGDHGPNHLGGSPVDRGKLSGTAGPARISLERSGSGQSAYQVHDEYVTTAAVDYLNQLGVQKRSGQLAEPFCLTLGFMLPHPPYVARADSYRYYRERIEPPRLRSMAGDPHPHLRWWREQTGIVEVSEEETLRARAAYWALVEAVDTMIGQVMSALYDNELADNVLILYTSDHGDMLGEHGLWWKHTFYEESAKVPLILSWPGVIPGAQRCERVVSALDGTASILDAGAAPSLPGSSGRSLLGLVGGSSAPAWEDRAFSEYCSDEFGPEGGCYQRMIREGEWKLVYYHGQPPQLFNLSQDPQEQLDLGRDPAFAGIRRELTAKVLDGWDPEQIAATMEAKRAANSILSEWARQTRPKDQFRWHLRPEMNYLE